MHEPILARNPDWPTVTLSALVGIADALERESVHRYAALADTMARRGELATAAAFRVMLEEEQRHVVAVERWAARLGEPVPPAATLRWSIPKDLSDPWDDVAGSARLTPYRAFAIAADNERRAFALYSYLAAETDDPRVEAEAERLALEELRHASLMRHWRRKAWHRERRAARVPPPDVDSPASLRALVADAEAGIAARHRAIAAGLRALGDDESVRLVAGLAPPGAAIAPPDAGDGVVTADDPVHLLVAAQAPLEDFADTLEALMRVTEGELFADVERTYSGVVARIARLAMHTAGRIHGR